MQGCASKAGSASKSWLAATAMSAACVLAYLHMVGRHLAGAMDKTTQRLVLFCSRRAIIACPECALIEVQPPGAKVVASRCGFQVVSALLPVNKLLIFTLE